MLDALRAERVDLVVASRYLDGGSAAGLSSARRERRAAGSNALARRLLGVDLDRSDERLLHDPPRALRGARAALSSQGFKILLDILATARGSLRIAELPFDCSPSASTARASSTRKSRSISPRW